MACMISSANIKDLWFLDIDEAGETSLFSLVKWSYWVSAGTRSVLHIHPSMLAGFSCASRIREADPAEHRQECDVFVSRKGVEAMA